MLNSTTQCSLKLLCVRKPPTLFAFFKYQVQKVGLEPTNH
nr:MAG TPA: hypothetical protein [Ackermannviridae sp.]DAW82320.1 MAG TPA: hypothetical protein [Bacteriophage sp.]